MFEHKVFFFVFCFEMWKQKRNKRNRQRKIDGKKKTTTMTKDDIAWNENSVEVEKWLKQSNNNDNNENANC